MPRVLRMPGVSANATEAVLAEWLVGESVEFAASDALATVETDKALVDIEAETAGVVLKTLVSAGSSVEVGAPIAVLGAIGAQVDDLPALLRELGVAEASALVVPERRDVPEAVGDSVSGGVVDQVERTQPDVDPGSGALIVEPAPVSELDEEHDDSDQPVRREGPDVDPESGAPVIEPAPARDLGPVSDPARASATPPRSGARIFASPLARKLAKDAGLTIGDIPGTGPRRRVLRRDVDAAVASRRATPVSAPAPSPTPASATVADLSAVAAPAESPPFEVVPHSRVRRLTAARLVESKQQAPHFYLRATVRVEALLALRTQLNDSRNLSISVNDLVVKAVAVAHARVPDVNVTWTEDAVRRWRDVDVAVAVATERGLMTPVVRNVGGRSVSAVAASARDLAVRAREGRLRQDELEGGSITVTNLGMFGVEEFAAIINPPHAAILAVGAVRDEPVVQDGAVVAGRIMSLTLSVDHRPVDGVVAAKWMAELTGLLEQPVRILA